jgi:hypothetical protein
LDEEDQIIPVDLSPGWYWAMIRGSDANNILLVKDPWAVCYPPCGDTPQQGSPWTLPNTVSGISVVFDTAVDEVQSPLEHTHRFVYPSSELSSFDRISWWENGFKIRWKTPNTLISTNVSLFKERTNNTASALRLEWVDIKTD